MRRQKAQGVIEGQERLFVEFGLALERVGFNRPFLGHSRSLPAQLAGVLLFEPVFFLHHVGEQAGVREVFLRGQAQIIVPMGQESLEPQIL